MGFRVVTIKSRCKLEFSLNYLVCRNETETKILLDEISTLVIASTEISITTALISALMSRNINVIFCDHTYTPQSQLIPIFGTTDSYKKIKAQVNWNKITKNEIWKKIVQRKILNQARNLKNINEQSYAMLLDYANNVESGDKTNREGHAAKVYFNSLFGTNFSRNQENDINKFLDYGYSIILSAISRDIKSFGYLTELGIHHIGENNPVNLACDFMEPLRPLIDSLVIKKIVNNDNFKKTFIEILNRKVVYLNSEMYLENAIHQYVKNLLMQLRNNTLDIYFIEYEL